LGHELKPFIESPQNVEHQSTVQDRLAEIGQGICHAFHLAAVVVDGEGTLTEGAKLRVEEHGARFAVVEELLLKAEPGLPGSRGVVLVDDVQEVGGDGVEDPGQDDTVHARPCRIVGAGNVAEDVLLQREAAEDEENIATPLGVVGGLKIKNDRN